MSRKPGRSSRSSRIHRIAELAEARNGRWDALRGHMKVAVDASAGDDVSCGPGASVRRALTPGMVPVMVTDAKGRSVAGLEDGDFLVLDNGRAQKIIVDSIDTGVAPIALVIAVQSSGISAAVIEKYARLDR